MHLQEALSGVLRKSGPFQRRLFLLMSLPVIMKGYQTMMVILIFAVPAHRCSVPGLLNDSYVIQDERHRTLVEGAIPLSTESAKFAQCEMYENWNGTENNVTRHRDTILCDSWVYDRNELESTLITQFNLVCDKKAYRAHFNLASMIGKLIGCFLTSFLCDRFGRKPIFLISIIGCAVVGTMSAFPPSPGVFFFYRLVLVTFGTAMYQACYVLVIEFMGPTKRALAGSLMMTTWVLGPLLSGATAYATGVWWHIQLISAVRCIVCAGYWWLVPESPRWLVSRGRSDEAAAVLKKVASANGVNIQHVSHSQATVHEDEEKIPEEKGFLHAYTLLKKYPRLVVRMLIIFFNWIVVNMTYYGLSLNVANLSGSIRVNFLLSSLVELTGYCGAWVLLDRLGRKRLHCACMTLAGVALLATILTVTLGGADLQWATTALAMIGKMGVSASFSIIFLLTSELYPTVIRNFGLGGSATVGRFGSIVSPYIADLALFVEGRIGPALPLIVFGGLTMAAGGLSLMLPETLHRKLPETLEDAVNFGKKDQSADVEKTEEEMTATGEAQPQDPFILN